MKILKKHVTCGEKKFSVAIDRDITVTVLEQYPDFLEIIQEIGKEQSKQSAQADTPSGTMLSIAEAARKKKLGSLLSIPDTQMGIVKTALPLMLAKAGESNPEEMAADILAYAEKYEVDDLLRDGLFSFLMEGFSLGERTRKHKVTFAMN